MAYAPTELSNASLTVGSYTVTLGDHQWDFADGRLYFAREGASYSQPYGTSQRQREVRFVKSTATMELLREVAYRAGLTGQRVKFIPNVAVPGTFWWIDWPTELSVRMIEQGRFEATVQLIEQAG